MSATDRRSLLRLAAFAVVAPVFGPGSVVRAASGARFDPPATPLRYTRRLVRELAGGYQFVASRSYEVAFRPQGAGFTLDGRQVAVDVSAPPKIAALADLERQRLETGLFPIRLDRAGLIADGPELRSAGELDLAVAEARRQLDRGGLSAGERAQAEEFVQMVHRVGVGLGAHLPRDLFAPADDRRVDRRAIALPNSESGEVTVVFTSEKDPGTGLMRAAQRAIVTTVDDDSRTTRENWTLEPL